MTTLVASSSLSTSQIPSQARIKNLSSVGCRSYTWISGTAVTSSPVAPAQPYRCGSFMRRSPNALETARPQRTLRPPKFAGPGVKTRQTPCMSTTPPLDSMRLLSSARPGLWSSVRRTVLSLPPCERYRTARESPRLHSNSLHLPELLEPSKPMRPSSGKIRPISAVEPSSTSRSRALTRNSSSVRTQASVTACRKVSSVRAGLADKHFWRFLGSHSINISTHKLPECPSRTRKPTMRRPSGASSCKSSM
mmetsp:Transcript_78388/g.196850  ORF Transcript_78388/g.196850 Transcript_78388/m.196850 type:complete len:250 (+) Transcript_78388:323-1072(+)